MSYSYMTPEHAAETEATKREVLRREREGTDLTGDALLDAATTAAGYNVGESGVERCDYCAAFYHRDYGGEYISEDELDVLLIDLPGVTEPMLLRLKGHHYCDLDCVRSAALSDKKATPSHSL